MSSKWDRWMYGREDVKVDMELTDITKENYNVSQMAVLL